MLSSKAESLLPRALLPRGGGMYMVNIAPCKGIILVVLIRTLRITRMRTSYSLVGNRSIGRLHALSKREQPV